MTRRAWLGTLALGLAASVLLAENGVVKTNDGQRYEGDVKENPNYVTITMHGVETRIPRSEIASIERLGAYADEYKARLAKLGEKDVDGRIALARDAFDKRQYELARDTLEGALAIDATNRQAAELLELVQSQIRLERGKVDGAMASPTTATSRPQLGGQAAIEHRLLTAADIEAIRKQEMKTTDTIIRVRFDGDVKKRYADTQNMPYATFAAMPAVEQARAILDKGDDSMKQQVHVMGEPKSMLEFRNQILPLVQKNCATSGCHGGPNGGGLVLFTSSDNESIAYTDFYILQSYSKKGDDNGGIFTGSALRLINRSRGERSLLVNYGLPTNVAEYDHPPVNGKAIQPIFPNKDDAKLKQVVDWMNNSLVQFDPDYGIHYTPPAATGPATEPAK